MGCRPGRAYLFKPLLSDVYQGTIAATQSASAVLAEGDDLSVYSQAQLNKVARQLNERPRKTLGFATPAERFNACVASTT